MNGSEPYIERHTPEGGGKGQTEGGELAARDTVRRRIHVGTHPGKGSAPGRGQHLYR